MEKKVCNTKELSKILDISLEKARQLCRADDFPSIKVGKEYKVVLSRLDNWLENHTGEIF